MSGSAIARELLVAHAALTAIVPAARILVGIIPQATALPCIGITEVTAFDHKTVAGHRGSAVKVTEIVQVTVLAATYPACKAALLKVRAALRDFTGNAGAFQAVTCHLEAKGPDFDDDSAQICMQTQDVRITYNEG